MTKYTYFEPYQRYGIHLLRHICHLQTQLTALLREPVRPSIVTLGIGLGGAQLGLQKLLLGLVDALELQDGTATCFFRLGSIYAPHLDIVHTLGELALVLEDFGNLLRRQELDV